MRLLFGVTCILSVLFEVNGFYRRRPRGETSRPIGIIIGEMKAKEHSLQQKLDHFDESNSEYWAQRFWSNDEFVKNSDSPIFLFVAGEEPARGTTLQYGSMYTWAEKYNAMLYLLEHRYFGESHPTPDASTENLKYLTSQQALADIAYFINETNTNNSYTSNNKWILFGGSYPGALVAWAKLHYPELIHGGVSSSAALQVQADYPGYNEWTKFAFDLVSPGCSEPIAQALADVQESMTTEEGKAEVLDKLFVCPDDFTDWKDLAALYYYLTADLGEVAQYSGQKPFPIHAVCKKFFMNETIGEPVERLRAFLRRTNRQQIQMCDHVSYEGNKNSDMGQEWSSPSVGIGNRQWDYLLCNEFGYYVTSESKDAFFGDTIPLKYYIQMCLDVFGDQFTEENLRKAVDEANQRNQGRDIQVKNVIFIHGNLDPFHSLGILNNPTDDSPFILINGTSHCQDMLPSSYEDLPALTDARKQIDEFLAKIIKN